MNKHLIILPLLFVSATALLLLSLSLPEDEPQVAASPSSSPAQIPSVTPASPTPATPKPQATNPIKASPSPSPSPSPTATPLPSFGIAATSPEAVLREAQANTGRVDPFKPILPPDLPEFAPAVEPEQLTYTQPPALTKGAPPVQKTTLPTLVEPSAEPLLTEGLVLKGIINGGLDPIAIVQTADTSELVRVGDRLPGNILVTSIYFEGKYITLSRGNQKARLELEEE
jgi:hypothetical protein